MQILLIKTKFKMFLQIFSCLHLNFLPFQIIVLYLFYKKYHDI